MSPAPTFLRRAKALYYPIRMGLAEKSNFIMIVASSAEIPPASCLDAFEPGFDTPRMVSPSATDPALAAGLGRALAYAVRRQPNNLLAHVQRINLLCASGADGTQIFGAAQALFDVLGDNGAALRKRIADQVAPLIGPAMSAALLTMRAAAEEPCRIVTTRDYRAAAETDPVAFADELLCAGDHAEAAAVLEAALAKEPASKAVAELLQSIYRSARDAGAYERSRWIVTDAAPEAAAWWPEVEVFFGGK